MPPSKVQRSRTKRKNKGEMRSRRTNMRSRHTNTKQKLQAKYGGNKEIKTPFVTRKPSADRDLEFALALDKWMGDCDVDDFMLAQYLTIFGDDEASGAGVHHEPPAKKTCVEEPDCVICLQAMKKGDDVQALPCIHSFHKVCISKWFDASPNGKLCPVCKSSVDREQTKSTNATHHHARHHGQSVTLHTSSFFPDSGSRSRTVKRRIVVRSF